MNSHTASFFELLPDGNIQCTLCPHYCTIPQGKVGFCGVRQHNGHELIAAAYGIHSGIALDPIEKKPLYHFHPGAMIVSIGGYGCNMRCPFCQNCHIAASGIPADKANFLPAADAAALAQQYAPRGNIGIAYTYNEPLINYEYLLDCAQAVRAVNLKNILVTNGLINPEPLDALLPYIDAMNIDLKGFTEEFYTQLTGRRAGRAPNTEDMHTKPHARLAAGSVSRHLINSAFETVKQTITRAHKHCHIEITTLIIPGENEYHIAPLAEWLASLDPSIPLHINRFFPRHRYAHKSPTPPETIYRLVDTAQQYLRHVYAGNL